MTTAVHYQSKNNFHVDRKAGSFYLEPHDDDSGELSFWYTCPCGCGRQAPLLIGTGFKPTCGPSWNFNGSLDRPTLTPSVHHINHWHGYLTDGEWKAC